MSTTIDESTIQGIVKGFQERTIPVQEWTHEAHLITAIYYLKNYSKDEATCWLRSGIITYNHSLGNQNSPHSGYHETLTLFWIEVVDWFIQENPDLDLTELCNAFLESPYSSRGFAERYYSEERLFSTKARARWVVPDVRMFDW